MIEPFEQPRNAAASVWEGNDGPQVLSLYRKRSTGFLVPCVGAVVVGGGSGGRSAVLVCCCGIVSAVAYADNVAVAYPMLWLWLWL